MNRAATGLGWLIEAVALAVLLLAPLPLGSVFPWAAWTIVGVVAALVGLSLVKMLAEGELVLRWSPLLGPGLAMAVLLAAQLVRADGSANPYATGESTALYLAYLGYLHVLGWHLVTWARIVRLLWVMAGWGTLLALFGLARVAGWTPPWIALPANVTPGRLVSTFLHPNHQALYFAMALFLTIGLMLASGRRRRLARARETPGATPAPRQLADRIVLTGAMAAIGTALLLTQSRGALVSAWIALTITVALVWRERRWAPLVMLVLGIIGMLGLTIAGPGLDPVAGRFSQLVREPLGDLRWRLWHATVRMALEHPWLGTGLGTFQDRFALDGFPAPSWHIDHAHNDYLQFWLETGFVGVGILAWAVVATGTFVVRRRAARRDPFARDVAVGAVGAALVALLHSAVDFGLRLPGNALLLAAVGALLAAAVSVRRGHGGEWIDLPTWRWAPTVPIRLAAGTAVGIGLAVIGLLVAPRALADWHLHQADRIVGEARLAQRPLTLPELARAWSQLERASRLDPGQPVIAAAAGGAAVDLASRIWTYGVVVEGHHVARSSAAERLAASEPYFAAAIDAYRRSLETRPQSGEVRERYGWLLAGLESVRVVTRAQGLRASRPTLASLIDTDESLVPSAQQQLQEAVSRDPFSAPRQYSLASFAHLHLGPEGSEVAVRASRQALTLDPSLLNEIVAQLASRSDWLALLPAAVPPRFDLWLQVAAQLEDRGRFPVATTAREETVALAANTRQRVQAELSWSQALLERGDAAQALVHARRALALAPDDPDVLLAMADAQQASGDWDAAEARLVRAIQGAEVAPGDQERATRLRIRLARLLTDRGQHVKALSAWREVLRATPNDAWAHFQVGALFETLDERASALLEYRLAEDLGRRDAGLLGAIAQSYARWGFLREAAEAYRRAIALQPAATAQLQAELRGIVARIEARTKAADPER